MKNLLLTIALTLSIICAESNEAFARKTVTPSNPIVKIDDPNFLYLADPAAEVYNGKVYVYCSHDQPDAVGYSEMQDYVVLESKDLKKWVNHGVVIKPREYSWASGQMNAPDAAYKNGWYYLYFPYEKTHIGVSKSRKPEGPWVEAVSDKITTIFDPTVFIDDDGQAYIYGNDTKVNIGDKGRHIMGAKLKENMIELDGEWHRLSEEEVNEAVHIFKRDGKYYFTARKGNRTAYFMAECPLPTKDKGYSKLMGYITPPQKDAPAHNSVIEFKGSWYLFYQRGDVNNGTFHRRSACFDELHFNEDGTIVPVTYTVDENYLNENLKK